MAAFQDASGAVKRHSCIWGCKAYLSGTDRSSHHPVSCILIRFKTTDAEIRRKNHFTWGAIKEVAVLFIGIFITMQPALMILKAKGAPVEQLIHTLEQYCNAELDEKWMYELAELYNQAGMEQLCVMTCDKIMLMFGLGKYVDKAMELKLQYAPLNQYQMDLVENKEKYEAKLKAVEQEYKKGTSIVQPIENTDRRQLDREEEPVEDTAEDETVLC